MATIFRGPFRKDIISLMLVSLLIGGILANGIAAAANLYFGKTIAGLVGEYGEYDVVIQVRDDLKAEAAIQIQKVIDEQFVGARLKEGPTITGKTNFFIALPEQYKNQQLYENLNKYFGSVPGGSSAGIMTEPRITLRGVPDGAKNMLLEQIAQIDGVRFAFRDGAVSIGVILTSIEKANTVDAQIKKLLNQYQVLEVAFPVGAEPGNSIKLGDTIAGQLQTTQNLPFAQNVTVGGKDNDTAYLVSTMIELKRFLLAYASQVTITPTNGVRLVNGSKLVFQGEEAIQPVSGAEIGKKNIVAEIVGMNADGTATAMIMQGDGAMLKNPSAFLIDQERTGQYVGEANAKVPREQIFTALNETTKLLTQLPTFAQDAQNASTIALQVLGQYEATLNSVDQTLQNMQNAGQTVQSVTSRLGNFDTVAIRAQLDRSSQAMGSLINTLQVLRLLQADVGATVDNMRSTQQNLNGLKQDLAALDNLSSEARRAKETIDSVVSSGNMTISQLRAFDVNGTKNTLQNIQKQLSAVQQINMPLVIAQLQYITASVPNLKDEELTRTAAVMDKFIQGQIVPGARLQILVPADLNAAKAQEVVAQAVGHTNFSLYNAQAGMIEPNTRGQVMQVLIEMKAILAAIVAVVFTGLSLFLDHTAVMAVLRRRRKAELVKPKGWRGVLAGVVSIFSAPERQYGMLVGAVMLTVLFVVSQAGIPYVPIGLVPVIGAVLGLLIAGKADKVNPISNEEVMAGEALGLTFVEIMREIVIPGCRPGLLQTLNKRRMKFK